MCVVFLSRPGLGGVLYALSAQPQPLEWPKLSTCTCSPSHLPTSKTFEEATFVSIMLRLFPFTLLSLVKSLGVNYEPKT